MGADDRVDLSLGDLRSVADFALQTAQDVLEIFERAHPEDRRPREAIEAARAFALGAKRGKILRDTALAALRAANEVESDAAAQAARAAMLAASAAYLHPLAKATQVKHILGAPAHAARALELESGDHQAGTDYLKRCVDRISPAVVDVLLRYPPAPSGGGRVGELLRLLDSELRKAG